MGSASEKHMPLRAQRKKEREKFYNNDLPYLLLGYHTELNLAGDFNCALSHSDATGQRNYSRVLDKLVTGFGLYDVGEQT
jgi:hypothetical protein